MKYSVIFTFYPVSLVFSLDYMDFFHMLMFLFLWYMYLTLAVIAYVLLIYCEISILQGKNQETAIENLLALLEKGCI